MTNNVPKAVIYTSIDRSFYVGRLETVLKKRNASPILLVSTGDELELLNRDGSVFSRSKSLLVPAGIDVCINTHNAIVAKFFLDDLGSDTKTLAPYMNTACFPGSRVQYYQDFQLESDIIEYAEYLSQYRPPSREAFEILNNWVDAFNPNISFHADPRVAKVAAMIKQNCAKNIPVSTFAAEVNLSIPRLIKLFNKVTGTSMRRYRNWNRIMWAAHNLKPGMSLTQAALDAGFNDYAHFSNAYRELAGASPSAARKNTEIHVLNAA